MTSTLHASNQEAWAVFHRTVAEALSLLNTEAGPPDGGLATTNPVYGSSESSKIKTCQEALRIARAALTYIPYDAPGVNKLQVLETLGKINEALIATI